MNKYKKKNPSNSITAFQNEANFLIHFIKKKYMVVFYFGEGGFQN